MCARSVSPTDESDLSARIAAAATHAGLGRHERTYTAALPRWGKLIRFGIVIAILDAIAIAAYLADDVGTAVLLGGFVSGPLTLVLVISAIRAGIRQWRYGSARLDLYENGLIRVRSGDLRVARYDATTVFERASIRAAGEGGASRYHFDLIDTAGKRFEVSDAFVGPWATEVRQAFIGVRFPLALAKLQAGERIEFGDGWLSGEGVGDRKRAIGWSEVESLTMMGSELVEIKGGGTSLAFGVSRFPDFAVFRGLFEYMRRSRG